MLNDSPLANHEWTMRPIFLTAAILLSFAPNPGRAQMVLPGAVGAPTPVGQTGAPPSVARRPSARLQTSAHPEGEISFDRHFVAAKPPSIDTVIGKPFALLGSRGGLQIEKSGDIMILSRLDLAGEKISQPNQSCQLAMGGSTPLRLKPLGAPEGLERFEIDSSACPLQFDVLNGALRANSPSGACVFREADCRVDAAGLWGPAGDSFTEGQKKTIERDLTAQEKGARGHFRTLMHWLRKDKAAARAVVGEQAAFSANRSQSCRDYDREDTHGFCALRLTEARDYGLQARLADESLKKQSKKDKQKDPKGAKSGPVARTASPQIIQGVKIGVPPRPSMPGAPRDDSAPKTSPRGLD
jgi:hypothetical protein